MNTATLRLSGAALVVGSILSISVSTSANAPAGRYTITAGTVYDTKTQLTWQQTAPVATFTQSAGATYCSSTLSLNGVTGWRLPTIKELTSIIDFSLYGPAIDPTAFPGTKQAFYWSATPYPAQAGQGWILDFTEGAWGTNATTASNYVRCVH
jgi:hypothetical protein